jgi:hypothetical protein
LPYGGAVGGATGKLLADPGAGGGEMEPASVRDGTGGCGENRSPGTLIGFMLEGEALTPKLLP